MPAKRYTTSYIYEKDTWDERRYAGSAGCTGQRPSHYIALCNSIGLYCTTLQCTTVPYRALQCHASPYIAPHLAR